MKNDQIAGRLEALGNQTRLEIFRLLIRAGDGGANVGTLQRALSVPGSTLTHHITRLVAAGLVSQQRQSREIICRAEYRSMDEIIAYLTAECCLGLDDSEHLAS
ncbi:MAG: helix-turn-helix transcriptional regulator [Rhodospirillaceae bacterium]|nr:helix-turn-helix transcriptional regulator [Rhodospirillaceae bacterium]